jgi:capsular exopolysaccharide synthesis family protein
MTTLPQTTTVRLPRPGIAPHLAVGGVSHLGGAVQPAAGGAQMTGADVWRVIRTNLWLIILSVIVAAGLGFAANWYLKKHFPRYTSTGLVQIIPPRAIELLPDTKIQQYSDPRFLETDQLTQSQLLDQDTLFSKVLTDDDLVRDTDWFKSFPSVDKAKQDLQDHFQVTPVTGTKLIKVAMSARSPNDAKLLVQELVERHLRDQRDMNRSQTLDRTVQLNKLHNEYKILLDDKTREIRQKAIDLNINGAGIPGRLSSKEIQLAELTRKQLELQMLAADAQRMFESTQQDLQLNKLPRQVQDLVDRDPDVMEYKRALVASDLQLQNYQAKYGPESQFVQSAQRQKDYYQQKLNERKAEVGASNSASLIEDLRSSVAGVKQKLDAVNQQINDVRKEMADASNLMSTYLTLMDEQKAYRELLKQVDDQLDAVNNNNDHPVASVDWMNQPDLPDTMSFPRLPITMSLAIVLGLAFSLGIAFLREMLDTSVRSPRDIARVGQLNLLGMISDEAEDPQATGARLPLIIAEAPHSMLAEQFRQMRTRLQHAASLDTTRSILVTSPGPGDGKTTAAGNLAAGLALNGRRILLVDANFRRPELDKLFGIGNEQGFSDVLNAVNLFDTLVQPTHVPNLAVLTSGAKPANPTELLESQLFIDFIERALEEYDHVIFDSGPLLFTSDTVAMAPRVDGVVSVVRARTNSRGLLQRMRDTLRQVKAEHLGVVLNAVRAQAGGYYNRNIKTYYDYQNRG